MGASQAIWRLGDSLTRLQPSGIDYERQLEDAVCADPTILGVDLLIIGRQVRADFGTPIDVLGIDQSGRLVVVELKRDRTPRDVVAQALDYASWVCELGYEAIVDLYGIHNDGKALESAFADHFQIELPDSINEDHEMLIVASSLDTSTERIVRYLAERVGAPINVALFNCFEDEGRRYLARTWIAEDVEDDAPTPRRARPATKSANEPWNGQDYVVTIGAKRSWEDARRHGYFSAGGGPKWTKPLKKIQVGARVFSYLSIDGAVGGYVGVGTVTHPATVIDDVSLPDSGGVERPMLEVVKDKRGLCVGPEDTGDRREHVVRVKWQHVLEEDARFFKSGMRALPASAFQLRHKFTRDLLIERFELDG